MAKRGRKPKRTSIEWSHEFSYAIGLISTDGSLSSDGRHIVMVSKDLEQLINIKQCLRIESEIKSHNPGTKSWSNMSTRYYRLQWGDIVLYNFLIEIGLTSNKSLTIKDLLIPDEYFFDFLRGSYDGDGCFYGYHDSRWKNSYLFYLTFLSASPEHILWMRETISRLAGLSGHVTVTGKKCPMITLKYAKTEAAFLLPRMFPSSETISLKRKRLKIMNSLGIVGKSLPA